MTDMLLDNRIEWSPYRDKPRPSENRKRGQTVQEALAASPYREHFEADLVRIAGHANRFERVMVGWWYYPFIYVEVRHARWKHYPCNMRMLISFDLNAGTWYDAASKNRHGMARRGWRAFMARFLDQALPVYRDCGHPEKTTFC